jgi:hypothetical protein
MREQDILAADPATLDEDELDTLIGSATAILKQLDGDKHSTDRLKKSIGDRSKALKTAQREARLERKGR